MVQRQRQQQCEDEGYPAGWPWVGPTVKFGRGGRDRWRRSDPDSRTRVEFRSGWAGTKSIKWNRKTISGFDLVLISTAHDSVKYQQLANWAPLIVDTRNTMARYKTKPGQVWKA